MLSGDELLALARDTDIRDLEGHVGALYAMRSEELSSRLNSTLSGYFASLLAAALALNDSGTDFILGIVGAATCVGLLSFVATVLVEMRLRELRQQSTASKNIVAILARRYPRP
jgi:hypothetical protein